MNCESTIRKNEWILLIKESIHESRIELKSYLFTESWIDDLQFLKNRDVPSKQRNVHHTHSTMITPTGLLPEAIKSSFLRASCVFGHGYACGVPVSWPDDPKLQWAKPTRGQLTHDAPKVYVDKFIIELAFCNVLRLRRHRNHDQHVSSDHQGRGRRHRRRLRQAVSNTTEIG